MECTTVTIVIKIKKVSEGHQPVGSLLMCESNLVHAGSGCSMRRISNPLMANLISSGIMLASFPVPFLKRENNNINSGLCPAFHLLFLLWVLNIHPVHLLNQLFNIVLFPLNKPCTCDLSLT